MPIPEEINQFYAQLLGPRWESLKPCLLAEEKRVGRWNRFARQIPENQIYFDYTKSLEIPRDENNLLQYYVMDLASIYVAQALDVQLGDSVLDMCAAPGGKTLILAEKMGSEGELTANELSENRRDRLKKVIQQYIPRDVRDRVWVTGRDGGKFALSHVEKFDRILIDAPCSGERHLLADESAVKEWKASKSEKLAQRQYALLTAALIALKPGGRIVYSTCSISPLENDQVIARLLKKKKDQFLVVNSEIPAAGFEKTEFGIQIWPDQTGFGPMYYSVLEKT